MSRFGPSTGQVILLIIPYMTISLLGRGDGMMWKRFKIVLLRMPLKVVMVYGPLLELTSIDKR